MEEVYAESRPDIVAAADYQFLYIGGAAVAYVLPGFYFISKKKGAVYAIWLMCATASIVMFFLNYSVFCNSIAAKYAVTGVNTTTAVIDQTDYCPPGALPEYCYYQTVQSELTHWGQIYAVATFTNYYYFQAPAPAESTSQVFLKWAPLETFDPENTEYIPMLYLTVTILFYIILIGFGIKISGEREYVDLQEVAQQMPL